MELLIKKAQKGDKEAFIQAISGYMTQMYKIARTRLNSDDDIGDAIQDTILAAYESLLRLKEPKYFKTWLIRILINKCNDIAKKSCNVTYIEDYTQFYNLSSLTIYNEDVEGNLDFTNILKILSEECRSTVVLYYVNDLTTKEISEVLNEKEGTIKSRLSRARQELKKHYLSKGIDSSSLNLNLGVINNE